MVVHNEIACSKIVVEIVENILTNSLHLFSEFQESFL